MSDQERLIVQQIKEWGEILTGFETKNKLDQIRAQALPRLDPLTDVRQDRSEGFDSGALVSAGHASLYRASGYA